ncbi:MAG: glycoside hydrolase domain-containing protein [Candidatus Omnitrophota bacterium]
MVKETILYVLVGLFAFGLIRDVKAESDFMILHPLYGQRKIVVDFDFKKSGIDSDAVGEIELTLISSGTSKVIEHQELKPIPLSKPRQFMAAFTMQDSPAGIYRLKAIAKDSGGFQLGEESVKEFTWWPKELEKFTWLNSKEGITEEVLPPWTPVEIEQKGRDLTVKVWGRAYHFSDNSLFPAKIETRGSSILAGPIDIIAKVDGKVVSFEWNSPKIKKQTPGIISFTREALSGGLSLSGEVQIEYDGMIRIDCKVTPKRVLKLEELTLEIPLLAEYAKYIYTPGFEGRVGFTPKDIWVTSFVPMIWLGDEERGLEWFCESEKDWYNIKVTRNIEVLPQRDVVKLRLHLVDKPIHLKPGNRITHPLGIPIMQPKDEVVELSYTFGLQATPVKPVIKDVWDYRFAHLNQGRFGTGMTRGSGDRFNVPKSVLDYGFKTFALHEQWTDAFGSTSTPYVEELKKLVKDCHERGSQVLLYLAASLSDLEPEWPLFKEECPAMPAIVYEAFLNSPPMASQRCLNICWKSVWQDRLADGLAKTMMDEYGVDGVYLDGLPSVFHPNGYCKNILHGCGYIGLSGRVERTNSIFACRQIMQRMYAIVIKRKPDGQINLHNSLNMLTPIMSWATSYWDGEHLGDRGKMLGISENAPILEKMPLDVFRSEFMGHQFGVPAEFLHDCLFSWDKQSTHGLAISLLHDLPPSRMYLQAAWKIMDEFGRKQAEWLPYWKNKEYVTVNSGSTDVYVSLYRHPKNGVLAVVANLGTGNTKVKIQLNLQNLKLKGKLSAYDKLEFCDNNTYDGVIRIDSRESNKPINMSDGGFEFEQDLGKFKIIWVKEE